MAKNIIKTKQKKLKELVGALIKKETLVKEEFEKIVGRKEMEKIKKSEK